jgi:hypothetical protein
MTDRARAPVFVIGCPRSGTTLLYHMLLSAGDFAVYRTETHVFNSLGPRFGDLRRPEHREAMVRVWLGSMMHVRSGLDERELRQALAGGFHDGGEFLRRVMDAIAAKQGVRRWGETTPAHLLHMHEIRATIPDALFVHVIRDGRDVAVSLQKQHWVRRLPWDRRHEVFAAAAFWDWMVRAGRRAGRRLGDAYTEVRYEDLVATPQAVLDRLGAFIDQPLDHAEIVRQGIGSVSRPNTSFPGSSSSFTGRWRQELPDEVAVGVEAMLAPLLGELAYPMELQELSGRGRAGDAWLLRAYHARFAARQWLKMHTPLGRRFADLALFAPEVAHAPVDARVARPGASAARPAAADAPGREPR